MATNVPSSTKAAPVETFIPDYGSEQANADAAEYERDERMFLTPADEYNRAYISFALLGAGVLLPWNSILSSIPYWTSQYGDPDMIQYFSIAYQSANLIGLAIVVLYGDLVSFRARIMPGFAMYVVLVALLPWVSNKILGTAITAVLGFVDSIVQGSIFGFAGLFNPRYVTALMAGQGIAGVLVTGVTAICKVSFDQSEDGQRNATLTYFGISVFEIIVCIACWYFVLERSPVTKHYLNKSPDAMRTLTQTTSFPLLEDGGVLDDGSSKPVGPGKLQSNPVLTGSAQLSYRACFSAVAAPAMTVFFNFWITLSLFPTITSQLLSTNLDVNQDLKDSNGNVLHHGNAWYPLWIVSTFMVGDWIGRTLPSWEMFLFRDHKKQLRKSVYITGVILRLVFIPLFILSIAPNKKIKQDAFQFLIMSLFAISNGYIGTVTMMAGPDLVPHQDKERAGTLMVFMLTGGLTLGVWTAKLWIVLINDWL